ncbi:MAG: hypothetical protein AAF358_13650 [Pseudomonadota bacterium]
MAATVQEAFADNFAPEVGFSANIATGLDISGSDRKAICIVWGNMRSTVGEGVTLGGVAMTEIVDLRSSDSSFRPHIFVYELLDANFPAGATADCVMDFSAGSGNANATVAILTGATQSLSTLLDSNNDGTTTGSSTSLTGTTTSGSDALLIGLLSIEGTDGDPSIVSGAGQTRRITLNRASNSIVLDDEEVTGGSSETHSWTYDAGCKGVAALLQVLSPSGGGGGTNYDVSLAASGSATTVQLGGAEANASQVSAASGVTVDVALSQAFADEISDASAATLQAAVKSAAEGVVVQADSLSTQDGQAEFAATVAALATGLTTQLASTTGNPSVVLTVAASASAVFDAEVEVDGNLVSTADAATSIASAAARAAFQLSGGAASTQQQALVDASGQTAVPAVATAIQIGFVPSDEPINVPSENEFVISAEVRASALDGETRDYTIPGEGRSTTIN